MDGAALNPVERRLMQMAGAWQDFRADGEARLLLWQVPESGLRVAECFVEVQKYELPYAMGDVFLLFKQSFVHGLQYSRELKVALRGIYDASGDDLSAQGLPADWEFDPAITPDTASSFAGAVRSFGSKYHRSMAPEAHLCIALWPPNVAHGPSFVRWIRQLLDDGLPPRLRVLLVDSQEHPRYLDLAASDDPRVAVRHIDVDGFALAQETFSQEGGVGPAAVFRNLMVGVVALMEKGSADQVRAKAVDALQFARRQGWDDQEVALRVMVAGAMLKEARHDEAVGIYESAREVAARTVAAQHPAGHKLVLQTWFGQGATHMAAGDDEAAANCYDQAALVACQDGDPVLTVEALRMTAFCMARASRVESARERGQQLVEFAQALPPEARGLTTLAVALVDQMRMQDPGRVREMQEAKRRLSDELDQVRMRADDLGAALLAEDAPDALDRVERQRSRQAESAAAHARAKIDAIAAGGSSEFNALAIRGRELLGADWLVDSDLALPPPYQPEPAS